MNRIVNLRGTSGSGKTYIARRIMEMYDPDPFRHFISGRKQPIGYTFHRKDLNSGPPLFVVGHYEGDPETSCGGADNLPQGLDYIYGLVEESLDLGKDVFLEGLIVASDTARIIAMHDKAKVLVVGLDTPLDECERSVEHRRAIRAERTGRVQAPLKMNKAGTHQKNAEAKFKALIPQRATFKRANANFHLLSRADALQACLVHLDLVPTQSV